MKYRAVGNRCAVNLSPLNLSLSDQKVLAILKKQGFKEVDVDMIALARECIAISRYRRGARSLEAPAVVDCSSFVKWLYGNRGIWLPRRSIQQRDVGELVTMDKIIAGDLVFVKGAIDWYHNDPKDGVGHVGIATGEGTVIHACDSQVNAVESSFERFIAKLKFRGARRYIPTNTQVITLDTPPERELETADDLRWIVLQLLPR
jgi:hypothetical protein